MSDKLRYRNRTPLRFDFQSPTIDAPELPVPEPELKRKPLPPRRKKWGLSPYTRTRLTAGVVTLVAFALVINLFHWQVDQASTTSGIAKQLHLQTSEITARRGLIYDANNMLLAGNSAVYIVWGVPRDLTEAKLTENLDKLQKLLPNVPRDQIKSALVLNKEGTNTWNTIAKEVDATTAEQIRAAKLDGIYLEPKPRRVYPNGTLLAHILGFTNFEMKGAYGVEGYYNDELSGQPGKILAERDATGNPIALGAQQISPSVEGADLTLTIDSAIQSKVERETLAAMFRWKATAASAIVMNPQTGAILAWVSYPDYDPNNFNKTDTSRFRDPNVSDVYEPGSTFKIFTTAIGIDTGAVTPETNAGTLPGCVIKYGYTVCNYNRVGYDNQTVIKTIQHSSNVGAMWIAEKFGPTKYYNYLHNFGIGATTGIDLSGEVEGIIRWPENKSWTMLDFDMNSFGQAVAVTPVQLVTAVSAVANGGKLVKPYVVSKISRDGKVIEETKPQVVRQIISPESSRTTTEVLVQAVTGGETHLVDVKGYRIAGKTGTAQIALPSGGYSPDMYIGSTVAYAPADNPQFLVLVRLDNINTFGSNTAAPAVQNIVEFLLRYYNIPPTEPVTPANQ
ncbi:MAG: penicillin-binding protein 2 [Chloroflexi bacterium]|uniref:Penicillin-binding protein 2 n=1 Tax=Candidatus Chlorohelix allophototropha TaxID=3003348 RepID=A0A8T7LUE8_9CHLR|nr:penicillin-binding protein 2 [Chloroflexota bacterium]WJW66370.1 penicillin-binding protein 2 [Chloroflexota bacterium L227-S17]